MEKEDEKPKNKLARGRFLTVLGSALLLPFLSRAQVLAIEDDTTDTDNEDYQILLKPDGSTVKVKVNHLKKSKTIKNGLTNSALKSWLNK